MTAPLSTFSRYQRVRTTFGNRLVPGAKSPAEKDTTDAARRWFRDLLWRAFPARSENELALRAAAALGVSERQVRNWLRLEHDAGVRYVFAVLTIAGAEVVFRKMEGRR
jgi:hypothetical protein